jgi:hypothetical protein
MHVEKAIALSQKSKRLPMKTACQILIKITSAAIVTVLAGCASPAEQQAYVSRIGNQELCMSWMTAASMNQYQKARLGEIRRRGLNCWEYGNVAEEQRKAEDRFKEALRCVIGCYPQRVTTPPAETTYQRPSRMGPGTITPGPTPYGR